MTPGTEIKPVVGWHALPDTPLRRAHVEVIKGLLEFFDGDVEQNEFSAATAPSHLLWMLRECLRKIETWPTDKISRWIGFVQGVLAAEKILDVKAERDRTRPLYAVAYGATE